MIVYLIGKITNINNDFIVLECNNIGYKINFLESNLVRLGETLKIFTYQQFKEDDVSLYGFLSNECKLFFEKLISVKGIGVKTAMSILQNNDYNNIIKAINEKNIEYLNTLPKISKKTANQIIIDLKDKVTTNVEINFDDNLTSTTQILLELGYSNNDINKIKQELYSCNLKDKQSYLKYAIKLLNYNDKSR